MTDPTDPARGKPAQPTDVAPDERGRWGERVALPSGAQGARPLLPHAPVINNPEGWPAAAPPSGGPDSLDAVVTTVQGARGALPEQPGPAAAEARAVALGLSAAAATAAEAEPASAASQAEPAQHQGQAAQPPSFIFFGVVSALSLMADVASKAWAEIVLGKRTMLDPALVIIETNLSLTLAYNKGGAWGLLQDASETVRKPFFLLVSVLAVAFIVSLYGRLVVGQRALKWGLPLVLGGALGNLSDRIVRNSVIDFIDYRADWVEWMNQRVHEYIWTGWSVTDHWPTYNVADISICVGVGLMAIDMLFSRRSSAQPEQPSPDSAATESLTAASPSEPGLPAAPGSELSVAAAARSEPGPTAAAFVAAGPETQPSLSAPGSSEPGPAAGRAQAQPPAQSTPGDGSPHRGGDPAPRGGPGACGGQ
jgi:signal peptidase II